MISLPDFSSGANASIPQLLSGATTDAAAGGRCDCVGMPETRTPTIRVAFNGRDGWEVALSDPDATLTFQMLEDARRTAFLSAARRQPCELVILDAYHRVTLRETRQETCDHERWR
jgi:hypothetical protein